jgi:hypothetical protein
VFAADFRGQLSTTRKLSTQAAARPKPDGVHLAAKELQITSMIETAQVALTPSDAGRPAMLLAWPGLAGPGRVRGIADPSASWLLGPDGNADPYAHS